jgi:CHAT domain-containing protein
MANNYRKNKRRKSKRTIMRSLTIEELSGVDDPAQEGATALILKRAPTGESDDDPKPDSKTSDGSGLDGDEDEKSRRKKSTNTGGNPSNDTEKQMDEKEVQDLIDAALAKSKEASDAELTKAQKFGELTDVQKAHYGELDDAGQTAFLEMTSEQRQAAVDSAIAKRDAADPVVYTADDGTEYRKSDDTRMVKMAQERDEDRRELTKMRTENEENSLRKRAEELEHLPGTVDTKIQMLKSIDAISDEKARDEALSALKAQNSDMAKAFDTHGVRPGNGAITSSAEQELDNLAKAYASDHKVDEAIAYGKVLETPQGAKLYEQSLQQ